MVYVWTANVCESFKKDIMNANGFSSAFNRVHTLRLYCQFGEVASLAPTASRLLGGPPPPPPQVVNAISESVISS